MLIGLTAGFPIEIQADSIWSGVGTETNPYLITNATELTAFATKVNNGEGYFHDYFKLTADISLNNTSGWENWNENTIGLTSWTPIGTDGSPFQGIFDGNTHTVSGIYINSSSQCQGLFGRTQGTIKNLGVINSYIKGGVAVGSVAGYNEGTIINCYNTSTITGTNTIGGVVGENGSIIKNCYNAGKISGNNSIGGVVGSNSDTIESCYYLDTSETDNINGTTYKTLAKMKDASFCTLLNTWVTDNGDTTLSSWKQETGTNNGYPILGVSTGGNTSEPWSGAGTEADPYLITDATELTALATKVNGGEDCSDEFFKLTQDISLNDTTHWGNWDDDTQDLTQWTPIGYWTNSNTYCFFNGTFDGNDHTISGIYISSTSNYQSLFAWTKGTIKNLGITKSYIKGAMNVGSVAGNNNEGTITNCYNTGKVIGTEHCVGGIAGEGGTITDCYNTGIIEGDYYVGGISGKNKTSDNCYNAGTISGDYEIGGISGEDGIIRNCYNTGAISGDKQIGGISGEDSTIRNCYNTGAISGDKQIGGISGKNKTSENCYNVGKVEGNTEIGGVVGDNGGGSIKNCYNAGTIIGILSGQQEPAPCCNLNSTIIVASQLKNTMDIGMIKNCKSQSTGSSNLNNVVGDNNGGKIEDSYYIGTSETDDITGTTFKTSANMQSSAFLDLLNDYVSHVSGITLSNWKQISSTNNGYPIFEYQKSDSNKNNDTPATTAETTDEKTTEKTSSTKEHDEDKEETTTTETTADPNVKTIEVIQAPSGIKNGSLISIEPIGEAFNSNIEVKLKNNEEQRETIKSSLFEKFPTLPSDTEIFPLDISMYIKSTTIKVQPNEGTSVKITCPIPTEQKNNYYS